jgi:hypothetical protein
MGDEGTKHTNSEAVKHQPASSSPALERHFSVAEVAQMWNLSEDAVRDIFRNEDGVLALGTIRARGKRQYLTLRIPASVLERVHRQMLLSKRYQER